MIKTSQGGYQRDLQMRQRLILTGIRSRENLTAFCCELTEIFLQIYQIKVFDLS